MVNFKAVVLFIRILTCFISHKTFGTGLHQGDLLEKFKENNLAKVNCLKLQTQEKPSRMFSLAYNLPKTMSNFCPSKLHRQK